MKDFILVEFLFEEDTYREDILRLEELGSDFSLIHVRDEWESVEDFSDSYKRVTGRISSMAASMIKLQNPKLAGKMRISYIPEDLKNKYRR